MFTRLPPDLQVWRNLAARYDGNVLCGLFLNATNEGLSLTPDVLAILAERGLRLDLDIYGAEQPSRP